MGIRRIAAIGLLLALFGTPAAAQALVTLRPVAIEFQASTDHDVTVDDVEVVSGYRALYYAVLGGASPVQTVDLCKPTPDETGLIRVETSAPCAPNGPLFATPLVSYLPYVVKVQAYGPGGSALSSASDPFVVSGIDNPVSVKWHPSSEHASVTSYDIQVVISLTGAVHQAATSVGKPDPDLDGFIRVPVPSEDWEQSVVYRVDVRSVRGQAVSAWVPGLMTGRVLP